MKYDLEERTAKFGEAIIDLVRSIKVDAVNKRIIEHHSNEWAKKVSPLYFYKMKLPERKNITPPIIKKEEVYKIIIGLPLNKKMKATAQTTEVENWAEKLVKKVAAPEGGEPRPDNSGREVIIDFENEIFTSKEAEKSGAKNVHSAAAALILQSYLDRS